MAKNTPDQLIRLIERFDVLPAEKRVAIFRELSPKAREELIQVVSRPGEIIRKISEEELYVTIKELGFEGAPALIGATTSRQLLYLFDLECWNKDMLDRSASQRWIEMLAGIGEEKILQFVQVANRELLLTMIDSLVRVHLRNPDVDLVEEIDRLPSYTLDEMFFVEFRAPNLEDLVKHVLETIFRWDQEYYMDLMTNLAGGVGLEDEESARKWRSARLADKGFPEFDEAVEIYRYMAKEGLCTSSAESSNAFPHGRPADHAVLLYPLKTIETDCLLRRCLNEVVDSEQRDRLARELAHLANKVMIADSRDPGSLDELYRGLRKVNGCINIALEELCGDNVAQGAEVVRSNHMEFLFRRGFSLIIDLRKEAQRLVRESEGGVENLGYPLAWLVQGLLQHRPVYYGHTEGDAGWREFGSLTDIHRIRQMINPEAIEENWEPI